MTSWNVKFDYCFWHADFFEGLKNGIKKYWAVNCEIKEPVHTMRQQSKKKQQTTAKQTKKRENVAQTSLLLVPYFQTLLNNVHGS